jgi:aryl-alcohol dehydrogenase-like predicted oxidoreductase
VHLASNQVEFSLLQPGPEHNGVLRACHELGVQLIASSPLGKGLLGGRYTRAHRAPFARRLTLPRGAWARLPRLLGLVREIGQAQGGKTPAQVALNWVMHKPGVDTVIIGARDEAQLRDNLGAVGWSLTAGQIARLDKASAVMPCYPYYSYRVQEGFARLNPPPV